MNNIDCRGETSARFHKIAQTILFYLSFTDETMAIFFNLLGIAATSNKCVPTLLNDNLLIFYRSFSTDTMRRKMRGH